MITVEDCQKAITESIEYSGGKQYLLHVIPGLQEFHLLNNEVFTPTCWTAKNDRWIHYDDGTMQLNFSCKLEGISLEAAILADKRDHYIINIYIDVEG